VGALVLITIVIWLYTSFIGMRLALAQNNPTRSYWAASLQSIALIALAAILVWKLMDREDEA
jgi:hypothetical protein